MVSKKDIEMLKEYASKYGWELRTITDGLYMLYIDGKYSGYQFENKPSQKVSVWKGKIDGLHKKLEWESENVILPSWLLKTL